MKKIFIVIMILMFATSVWAQTKVTDMTAATGVLPTDLGYVVATPQSAAASRKIELSRLTYISVTSASAPTVLNQGYYYTSYAGTTTYVLPVISATPTAAQVPPGWQACFAAYTSTVQIIKVEMPSSHVLWYKGVASTAGASHGYQTTAALGDILCVVAVAANVYIVPGAGSGTWASY